MKPAAIVVAGLGLPVMLIVALIGLVSYEEAEAVCLPGGPALSVDPSSAARRRGCRVHR